MNKQLFFLLFLFVITAPSFGQKIHYIELRPEIIELPNRGFYIEKVVDERYSKAQLGWTRKGLFNTKIPVDFESSFRIALEKFFAEALPQRQGQVPVTAVFKVLKTSEGFDAKVATVTAELRVEFFYNEILLFRKDAHVENTGEETGILLEESLREVLKEALEALHGSNWEENVKMEEPQNVVDNKFENPDAYVLTESEKAAKEGPITYNEEELKEMVPQSRDVFAIGLGLGGISLVGINYEARLTNLLGVHGGVGYLATDFFGNNYFSYTGGLKIHTGPTKNHSFINLSYKDAGIGMMGAAVVEYGDRVVFSKKKDFGMVWQAGLGVITHMNDELSSYYGEQTYLLISAGIGLSFNLSR